MNAPLTHAVVTTACIAAALFAYDRLVRLPALVVGVVDVGEVYRRREAAFAQQLTQSRSEADRQKALAGARAFAQRLPAALEELPRDCECLVLVRTAVAGAPPHAVDLTAHLLRKVESP